MSTPREFPPTAVDLPESGRRLLKPSEVAKQLGVSRAWLYAAAKTGRLPSIRIGGPEGPVRFVPEDLDRWIDEARSAWLPGHPSPPTSRREKTAPRRAPKPGRAGLGRPRAQNQLPL